RTLDLEPRTHVARGDVVRQLPRLAGEGRRFEIVFLDPPYATDDGERALAALGGGALIASDGLVIAQHLTKRRPQEYGVLRAFRLLASGGLPFDVVARARADCIVRGIRAVCDFEYEFQMALMNRKLRSTVETVFLMPHEKYTYISSRLMKEVASFGTSVAGMVPPIAEKRLTEKYPPK